MSRPSEEQLAATRAVLLGGEPNGSVEGIAAPPGSTERKSDKKTSQATRLVELADERRVELFHDDLVAYATIAAGAHRETWPVRGRAFKRWLQRAHYESEGGAAGGQAVTDALGVLEGQAIFDGAEIPVHVRLAEHGGAVFLDLGDEAWDVVKITASGWSVVHDPPVRFRRPRGMGRLPAPVAGGSLDELRPFLNVASEDDFTLIVAWLVNALRPTGPYPALALHGEQGTAKSTTARVLRLLVDPNAAPLRSEPREARDLMIAATNGRLVVLDNLSHLRDWLSDALCRLATGGGFATRELYSDDEEIIFDAQRPVIINGIGELATRGDLLDRVLLVYQPVITKRRAEDEFWADFERVRPRLLGVLLDAVAMALGRIADVRLADLPRMADFAKFVVAAEPALGWPGGAFLEAYTANRESAHDLALEVSPIAVPIGEIADKGTFSGTATELLERIETMVEERITKRQDWPKSASALSVAIRRIAPNLREQQVEVEFEREGRSRLITISRGAQNAVIGVIAVTDGSVGRKTDDGDGDGNDGPRVGAVTQDRLSRAVYDGDDGDDGDLQLATNRGNVEGTGGGSSVEGGGAHAATAEEDAEAERIRAKFGEAA